MINQNSKFHILAVETSCDETAASLIEANRQPSTCLAGRQADYRFLDIKILSNIIASQIDLHKQYGGVFPEIASRAHSEQIIPVVEEAMDSIAKIENHCLPAGRRKSGSSNFESHISNFESRISNIDIIAVTTGPGLIGSLLIGVNFAKTLAFTTGKPIIGINHWLGHIYSNWLTDYRLPTIENAVDRSPSTVSLPRFPALILIVSGGHTGLVLMKSHNEIVPLGETLDDAAGEAFDKVAKLLGLDYPGGPSISKAANGQLTTDYRFPRAMLNREGYDFSFSGLKTAVLNKVKELDAQGISREEYQGPIAKEFQQTVIEILIGKTLQAAKEYNPKSICLCGGVSANKELRSQMETRISNFDSRISFHVPPMDLTTDNAAMIGIATSYQIANGVKPVIYKDINANANAKL